MARKDHPAKRSRSQDAVNSPVGAATKVVLRSTRSWPTTLRTIVLLAGCWWLPVFGVLALLGHGGVGVVASAVSIVAGLVLRNAMRR